MTLGSEKILPLLMVALTGCLSVEPDQFSFEDQNIRTRDGGAMRAPSASGATSGGGVLGSGDGPSVSPSPSASPSPGLPGSGDGGGGGGGGNDDRVACGTLPSPQYQVERTCSGIPAVESSSPFHAGNGTETAPYLICTPAQLLAIGSDPNFLSKVYEIRSDLDFSGVAANVVIGTEAAPFTGEVRGKLHRILNLKWSGASGKAGLFDVISDGSKISNVEVHGAEVFASQGRDLGLLVGEAKGGAEIRNVKVSGIARGQGGMVAGIVAKLEGASLRGASANLQILNPSGPAGGAVGSVGSAHPHAARVERVQTRGCIESYGESGGVVAKALSGASLVDLDSNVQLDGETHVGGVVGRAEGANLHELHSSGSIGGISKVGGVVGDLQGSILERSAFSGEVRRYYLAAGIKAQSSAGGVVGEAQGSILRDLEFLGSLTVPVKYVGGIVGSLSESTFHHSTLKLRANQIQVLGAESIGGMVGKVEGGVLEHLNVKGSMSASTLLVGGVAGQVDGVEARFLRSQASIRAGVGNVFAGGVFGRSFNSEISHTEGHGQVYGNRAGLVIGGARSSELEWLRASGEVRGSFAGGIVGQLWISEAHHLRSTATVIGIDHESKIGISGTQAGGLIGHADGRLNFSNLVSEGEVTLRCTPSIMNSAGGLIGQILSGMAEIRNSYATGNVTGNGAVGGLMGRIDSSLSGVYMRIQDVYATGTLGYSRESGSAPLIDGFAIGGLIGYLQGAIVNSVFSHSIVDGRSFQNAGALFGKTEDAQVAHAFAKNGKVTGSDHVGGVAGFAERTSYSNVYTQTPVDRLTHTSDFLLPLGAAFGMISNISVEKVHYDVSQTSHFPPGHQADIVAKPLTPSELLDREVMAEKLVFGNYWGMNGSNGGTPHLRGVALEGTKCLTESEAISKFGEFHSGDGTRENPYLLCGCEDLAKLESREIETSLKAATPLSTEGPLLTHVTPSVADVRTVTKSGTSEGGKYYQLGRNLRCGPEWEMVISHFVNSTLDGRGYSIVGRRVNNSRGSAMGLFGQLNRAVVTDLTIKGFKLENAGAYAGILAGWSDHSILSHLKVLGSEDEPIQLSADHAVGLLIGRSKGDVIKRISLRNASVSGKTLVGAISGMSEGTVISRLDLENIRVQGTEGRVAGIVDHFHGGSADEIRVRRLTVESPTEAALGFGNFIQSRLTRAMLEGQVVAPQATGAVLRSEGKTLILDTLVQAQLSASEGAGMLLSSVTHAPEERALIGRSIASVSGTGAISPVMGVGPSMLIEVKFNASVVPTGISGGGAEGISQEALQNPSTFSSVWSLWEMVQGAWPTPF